LIIDFLLKKERIKNKTVVKRIENIFPQNFKIIFIYLFRVCRFIWFISFSWRL